MRLFGWFKSTAKAVVVQAIRRKSNSPARTGRRRYNLVALVNGKIVCMMTLSATFSAEQYELALSKLLAKIYRRFKWLVSSVTYLSPISN